MNEPLIIVGASARAAAMAAVADGYTVRTADLFADADLAECCSAVRLEDYPHQLAQLLPAWPSGAWMYCGALENYPGLVDRLAAGRPLLGNSGATLRQVRNPFLLASTFARHGLAFPETVRTLDEIDSGRSWLRKPRMSAGGLAIEPVTANLSADVDGTNRYYYQCHVAGQPCAAVFVAAGGESRLLGITAQRFFNQAHRGSLFCYAGSIGPWPVSSSQASQIERIGQVLAQQFSLKGLYGVDLVLDDQTVWGIEVNPRYTASVEIIERTSSLRAIPIHWDACRHGRLPDVPQPAQDCCAGKRILYARKDLVVSDLASSELRACNRPAEPPLVADIPPAGTPIACGRPMVTLLADGPCLAQVESQLHEAQHWIETLT